MGERPVLAAGREAKLDGRGRADDRHGLFVVNVDPDGPARGRLQPGDVIVGVLNPTPRREVRSVQDLQAVLSRVPDGGYVSLSVYNSEARNLRVVNLRVGS